MSRLILSVVAALLLVTAAAAQTASPAPSAPQQIGDLRTVFLINTNADRGVFYHVSAIVQGWGRWKVVAKREDADLLLVLSEKKETVIVMFDPMRVFEPGVYYFPWPGTIEVDTLTLAEVDRATGHQLLTVSCARHHAPSAPKWLVSRLNKKIEKSEKSG